MQERTPLAQVANTGVNDTNGGVAINAFFGASATADLPVYAFTIPHSVLPMVQSCGLSLPSAMPCLSRNCWIMLIREGHEEGDITTARRRFPVLPRVRPLLVLPLLASQLQAILSQWDCAPILA
jgi:hypothetical protein